MHDIAYLDNAATTRVDERVVAAMAEAMTVHYGNPSSAHRLGVEAWKLLEQARARVAAAIGGEARDVYFTSGGTEANAIGVLGVGERARGRHVVLGALEHPSVADAARRLGERGFTVADVAPTEGGVVEAEAVAAALREDTALVAVMLVSNELGTVQPIAEIVARVRALAPKAHVHVDAVQGLGKVAIDVRRLGIDSLAVSAHKIHGPKGAGALWLRRGAQVASLTVGGGQEGNVRPGTQGVPGAVGLGLAAEIAEAERPAAVARMAGFRARVVEAARAACPDLRVHGEAAAAPHILSLGFPHTRPEPLLHALEARGVFVSAGSACASHDRKPSRTMQAIGAPAHMGTLRVSFSRLTTDEDIGRAAASLETALAEVR